MKISLGPWLLLLLPCVSAAQGTPARRVSPGAPRSPLAGLTVASARGGVPSGAMILGDTASPPPGYSNAGLTLKSEVNAWSTAAPLPFGFFACSAATIAGKLHALGYFGYHVEYDAATETWVHRADLPSLRAHTQIAELGGKLYCVGGTTLTDLVEVYDPASDAWSTVAPLSAPRSNMAVAALDGKLYCVGGYESTQVSTVERFDPSTGLWSPCDSLSVGRWSLSAAVLDGRLHALGGHALGGVGHEVYDPNTDSWTILPAPPTPRSLAVAVAYDGRMYLIGGAVIGGASDSSVVEAFDPATGAWSLRAPLPTGRSELGAALVGQRIHTMGGAATGGASDVHELYVDKVELYVHRKD